MAYLIMCTKADCRGRQRGFTLVEMLITSALSLLCLGTMIGIFTFYARSSHAMMNYAALSSENKIAMDYMSRDIREALRITAYTGTTITLLDCESVLLTYAYNPATRTFTRNRNGISRVLLRECDRLKFDLGQRNPVSGSYDVYPATTNIALAKVVDVSWLCSRKILGVKQNTESVQTARIVMRNHGS